MVLHNFLHNVAKHGYYNETIETYKHCFYVFAVATIYVFAAQSGSVILGATRKKLGFPMVCGC